MLARMWVTREKLDISESEFTAHSEDEFWLLWNDVGEAASRVEAAWNRAIKVDPLIARALECLNRSNDLTVPYNALRNSMCAENGRRAMATLEKEGAAWLQLCGLQWLDLDDRALSLLYLRCGGIIDGLTKNERKVDATSKYGWLAKTSPGAEFIDSTDNILSEDDALDKWRIGLQQRREHYREQRDSLRKSLNAPDEFWAYLLIREESDSLGEVGEAYLQAIIPHNHPYIAEKEKEFNGLFQRAGKMCPSLMKAIYAVHQSEMEQDVVRLKKLHEELLSKRQRVPGEIKSRVIR